MNNDEYSTLTDELSERRTELRNRLRPLPSEDVFVELDKLEFQMAARGLLSSDERRLLRARLRVRVILAEAEGRS